MAKNKWTKLFKGMKTKWNEARKNKDQAFVPLAEGQYYVRLAKCNLGESKSGSPQVAWAFVVVDGDSKGKQVWAWDNLDSEWGLQSLARRLDVLGHDLTDLGDLPETLDGMVEEKPLLKVRVRHSKAKDGDRVFVNVDFERLLDDETEIEDEDVGASFDDVDSNLTVSSEDEDADLGDDEDDEDEEDEDDEEEHEDDDEDEEDEEESDEDDSEFDDDDEDEEDEEEAPPKKRGRPKKDKSKTSQPKNKEKVSKSGRPTVGQRTVSKRAPSKASKKKR